MLVLLLNACGEPDGLSAARASADAQLHEHPSGTVIVRAHLGQENDSVETVTGTRWHGTDLAEWLAPCDVDGVRFTAALRLEPGQFPWKLVDDEGVPPCAVERLARFPFEEPSRRGEADLVVVRWRPDEQALASTGAPSAPPMARSGVPAGLLALAPPYYRRSPSGDALHYHSVRLEDGRVRIPVADAEDVVSGPLDKPEAWARHLTCEADALGLVRLSLVVNRGFIEDSDTSPKNECVVQRAFADYEWVWRQTVDGVPLRDAGRVLVVLDVPVGPW